MVENFSLKLDESNAVFSVLLDRIKAFDCRLQSSKINRFQNVLLHANISDPLNISKGVPL